MKTGAKILTGVVIAGVLAAVIVPRLMKEEPPIEAAPLPNVTVENPLKRDIVLESGLIGTIEPSDILYVTPQGCRRNSAGACKCRGCGKAGAGAL